MTVFQVRYYVKDCEGRTYGDAEEEFFSKEADAEARAKELKANKMWYDLVSVKAIELF